MSLIDIPIILKYEWCVYVHCIVLIGSEKVALGVVEFMKGMNIHNSYL